MQSEATMTNTKPTLKPPHGVAATDDDIYYAYRLFLGREPDAQGFSDLSKIVADTNMSADALARSFMASPEFLNRRIAVPSEAGVVEVELDGFSIYVRADDRDIARHIRATRVHEPHVTEALMELLGPGNVFVDVGANIGFFTNMAAHRIGASGFVLAVEPMDKNVQLIHRALERNGFSHVRVMSCAASDRDGRVAIKTDDGTSNGQAIGIAGADVRTLYAQTLRLDELVRDLLKIDVVKLDIEGFELLAWRGFREGLARHRPRVFSEFHPYCMCHFVGIEPAEYLAELFAYGSVDVLPVDGDRIRCTNPNDVMRLWQSEDDRYGVNGKSHLDLLVTPR